MSYVRHKDPIQEPPSHEPVLGRHKIRGSCVGYIWFGVPVPLYRGQPLLIGQDCLAVTNNVKPLKKVILLRLRSYCPKYYQW